jgi:hypothetical protein
MKAKYIKTKDNVIIVFSELLQHKQFKHFEPVSAGFISIGAEGKYEPSCTCYGESVSLDLKSDEEVDTKLARKQILGYME